MNVDALIERFDLFCIPTFARDSGRPGACAEREAERQFRQAIADGRWETVWTLFLENNGDNEQILDFFEAIADQVPDRLYWELLRDIWVRYDKLHDRLPRWRHLFRSPRDGRDMFLMDDDERDFLANLAPTLTIYRGYTDPGGEDGLSWSLNQEVARSYAMTWAKRQLCDERIRSKALYLASVEVPRDRLICYWCRDDEVIVPTLCGVETRTERIGECRTDHAGTLQLYDAHGHLQPP